MNSIEFFKQHLDLTPQALLASLEEQDMTELEDFLFFDNFNDLVLKNAEFLKSPETLNPTTLTEIFEKGGIVLARSIDGDFLLGFLEKETWVLPTSFNLKDIEKFPLSPQEFLITWLNHDSPSHIIN